MSDLAIFLVSIICGVCAGAIYHWLKHRNKDKKNQELEENLMYIHRDGENEPITRTPPITVSDSFRVEESYNWRDDVMEITRRIVHDTDEARLSNIAEHFEVDLSEIREIIEHKKLKIGNRKTNRDKLHSMTNKQLAEWLNHISSHCVPGLRPSPDSCRVGGCTLCWLDWLGKVAVED